jgi:hypothetical protein
MTTTVAPATLPALQGEIFTGGYDGRYRLYTVAELPFDALPSYRDGGPGRVVINGWSTSSARLCRVFSSASVIAADDHMVTVRATRGGCNNAGRYCPELVEHHALNGAKFATDREADQAVYEAGLTAFMVYEKQAAAFGLPTVRTAA